MIDDDDILHDQIARLAREAKDAATKSIIASGISLICSALSIYFLYWCK